MLTASETAVAKVIVIYLLFYLIKLIKRINTFLRNKNPTTTVSSSIIQLPIVLITFMFII